MIKLHETEEILIQIPSSLNPFGRCGFPADVLSLVCTCWRKVVQETWKQERQILILLVCMHWSSCLINVSYSICS